MKRTADISLTSTYIGLLMSEAIQPDAKHGVAGHFDVALVGACDHCGPGNDVFDATIFLITWYSVFGGVWSSRNCW